MVVLESPMVVKPADHESKLRSKYFATEESYIDFMEHPSRVVRLEWRYLRRPEHYRWTSHSVLEVYLNGGARTRLERFADRGFVETLFDDGKADCLGEIYRGRSVSSSELSKPLFIDDLSEMAAEFGKTPYSVRRYNCHHFVRDLWNNSVVETHRHRHYPDRVKSGVLRGVTLPFHRSGSKGQKSSSGRFSVRNALGFQSVFCTGELPHSDGESDESSDGEEHGSDGGETQRAANEEHMSFRHEEAGRNFFTHRADRVHISFRHEEAGRISGQYAALSRQSLDFDLEYRHKEFVDKLKAGTVYVLEPGSALAVVEGTALQEDKHFADDNGKHLSAWLSVHHSSTSEAETDTGFIAARLSERVGAVDLDDLVRQLVRLVPDTFLQEDCIAQDCVGQSPPSSVSRASFKSVQSLTIRGTKASVFVVDSCSVVLHGATETRLAIYALLSTSRAVDGRQDFRLLRLLSGDVLGEQEGVFAYTLYGDPGHQPSLPMASSALDAVLGELEAMLTALATGDWGFVTLK